jgi:hypothetical protein
MSKVEAATRDHVSAFSPLKPCSTHNILATTNKYIYIGQSEDTLPSLFSRILR